LFGYTFCSSLGKKYTQIWNSTRSCNWGILIKQSMNIFINVKKMGPWLAVEIPNLIEEGKITKN